MICSSKKAVVKVCSQLFSRPLSLDATFGYSLIHFFLTVWLPDGKTSKKRHFWHFNDIFRRDADNFLSFDECEPTFFFESYPTSPRTRRNSNGKSWNSQNYSLFSIYPNVLLNAVAARKNVDCLVLSWDIGLAFLR